MNIVKYSLKKDGEKYIAKNFQVKEFACHDGTDEILIDMDMIPKLQKIRDIGGRVTINSAFRTSAHNKKVGGASNSYHLKGMAFDITSEKLKLREICDLANTLGVKGIILYPTFVHVDGREKQYHANNKGNLLTFGTYPIKEERKMFTNENEALDFLIEKDRITNDEQWRCALKVVKDLNWLIIKWANDVLTLENE